MTTKKDDKQSDVVDLGHGMTVRVVEVTPAMAERWLEKNHEHNRRISDERVQSLANDMRSGNWRLTHQGICFDAEDVLIDGQHRLWAVFTSKCTVKMMVCGNTHGELSDPIDTNRLRSTSFLLAERPNVVSAANVLRYLENGYRIRQGATPAETTELLEHHRGHIDAIRSLPKCHSMPGSILGALAYVRPIDPARTDEFASKITTGEMIQQGDAAYAFRKWRESASGKAANSWEMAMAVINAARYAILDTPLRGVFVTEEAYKAATGKRRIMKIPHTPTTALVPAGGRWSVKSGGSGSSEQ